MIEGRGGEGEGVLGDFFVVGVFFFAPKKHKSVEKKTHEKRNYMVGCYFDLFGSGFLGFGFSGNLYQHIQHRERDM